MLVYKCINAIGLIAFKYLTQVNTQWWMILYRNRCKLYSKRPNHKAVVIMGNRYKVFLILNQHEKDHNLEIKIAKIKPLWEKLQG